MVIVEFLKKSDLKFAVKFYYDFKGLSWKYINFNMIPDLKKTFPGDITYDDIIGERIENYTGYFTWYTKDLSQQELLKSTLDSLLNDRKFSSHW